MTGIGFIGFGEAAHAIARGLRGAGAPALFAYDIALDDAERGELVAERALDAGVTLVGSSGDLASRCAIVFSAVVTSVAAAVAEDAAAHLNENHVYVDLNSTSPALKQRIGRTIEASGARFVEAAVMAAVPPLGHRVPMLLCGAAVGDLMARLAPYGMELDDLGSEIGGASATKMFRSIVVKGLEALLLECIWAAAPYGVAERVLDTVGVGYPGLDWNKLAHYLLGRTAVHGKRRAHEMEEVAETLKAMEIEPIMAAAAARRLSWAAGFDLEARFGAKPPEDYHQVVDAIREAGGA